MIRCYYCYCCCYIIWYICLACYFSHYSHATRNFSSQVLAELRTKEKERVERHKLLDSRRKWREEEERKQVEKERRYNDRAHALDRARNVRPTDISDSRQLGSPFKGERKRTSKRDLEARRNNPKPYSALDAGGDNDQPYSHASARGSHTRKGNSRDASPNGGNSVLSQLQKAYGNSNDGNLRRKRPGASSGGTPRTKDGTPRSRDPSPRPQGRDPSPRPQGSTPRDESLLRSRGRSRSRDGTPKQRRSSGRRNGGGSGNGSDFRRSESASSTLRDAGRRSLSSSGQAASYTGF